MRRFLAMAALLLLVVPGILHAQDPFGFGAPAGPGTTVDDASDPNAAPGTPKGSRRAPQYPLPSGALAPLTAPGAPVNLPALPNPEVRPQPAQLFDYSVNLNSEVFGAQLFTGAFARQASTQFNPNYVIAVGDTLQVRLWGAYNFDALFTVDPQGNVFLPHVGPVKVLGIRNQELQATIDSAIRRVFRANVFSYASLAAAQPVRVFVGGFVQRPGLYDGTSTASLLHYLDQAGGIDSERGSFLNVQVKRGDEVRATVNLYEFLLAGRIPVVQFADGDVVFVNSRQRTVKVGGLVENAKRFEFSGAEMKVSEVMAIAKPRAQATHVRIIRNTGSIRNVEYFAIENAGNLQLGNGDEIEFTSDRKPGTITVRVEGEHLNAQEYVLPHGSRLGELMKNIQFSERSDSESLQLYRLSVRERQKAMLQTALRSLESTVLTARSGTSDEARLRKEEAGLILQWIDRAKKIEPAGQVLIAPAAMREDLLLENGDIVRVPVRDGLVLISGEVLFPNAIAYEKSLSVDDYIRRAGGYAQNADTSRIVVAHRDGSFFDPAEGRGFFGGGESDSVRPGDEILVLPKIDVKSRQITKDWSEILFHIAVTAKVILGL